MNDVDSDEDNLIRYGTPLEPYEEDEVPSKKKRDPTEQHALDVHGRRRFHGAFTGGFSAGFGNTVGTPEGWIPATFKSSRSEKAKLPSQRPEDFMDEEDRSEFGIAPRQIQTQNEFSHQKRAHQQKRFHDGPIPGEPVLEQLLRPVHESTVVRMLKDMGWKPGQGAGERLTKQEKKNAKEKHRVYGCYMPPEMRKEDQKLADEDSDSDVEFNYETLFAPDDYEPYILRRKDDRFGLGYSGLSRHSVLGNLVGEYGADASSSSSHLLMNDKGKKVSIHGQAFGVGALEEDDEDIYAKEDMSHYDFVIGGPKPIADKQKDKQKSSNVLQEFVKSTKPLPTPPSYPPPALPRDYIPLPAGKRRSRFEPDKTHEQRDQGLGRHELSAEARGALLGEQPIERKSAETENIKSDLNSTDERISRLLGRNVDFVTTNKAINDLEKDDDEPNTNPDFIPMNKSKNDNISLFKPFVSDPVKQARYEKFLESKDKSAILEKDERLDRLSEWEKHRELMEFEQAAKLYKPLTGVMGDRFTHASQPDEALNPLCAVAKSSGIRGGATQEQIDAASKGLYGTLTRNIREWRPEALVCKRFNIPNPFEMKPEQRKDEKSKTKYSIFEYLESSIHNKESFTKEQSQFSGSKSILRDIVPKCKDDEITINKEISSKKQFPQDNLMHMEEKLETSNTGINKRMTVAELFLRESEKDQVTAENKVTVTETIEKFDKMELYKAIFLSDSEEEELPQEKLKEPNYSDFVETPKNVERNTSPPRGIFANLDFDELNSWNRNAVNKEEKESKTESQAQSAENEVDDGNMYGPKIPETLKVQIENTTVPSNIVDTGFKPNFRSKSDRVMVESSSSSESWVEAKEFKHKKKKKHKKHKSKKSKHKKKDK